MFDQHPYRVRLEWGRRGAREAAERGDIVVIVDVLSFSSAVATAVQHDVSVYPCADGEDPVALAKSVDAEPAVRRRDVPDLGRFSLSPLTYVGAESGSRVVLSSPNGATCCSCADRADALLVGCFLNATAVAKAVSGMLDESSATVTVVSCGERWREESDDGPLRIAIEDYLGAGAIIAGLSGAKSPEALVCEGAFRQARGNLAALLWDCGSGRELRNAGFQGDVRHAVQIDLYDTVPVLRDGRFEAV